jgi:hypothetical protein
MKLSERAILLSLRIHAWSGTAVEKNGARDVERAANAVSGTVRARKVLLPAFPELLAMQQFNVKFRNDFNERTLAYDEGTRLAPTATAQETIRWIGDTISEGEKLADALAFAYPDHLQLAEDKLGTLFDRRLYPSPMEIRNKFGYRLTPSVVPDTDQLRNFPGFSPEEVDNIVAKANESVKSQLGEAMRDLWTRVYDVTHAMHEKLSKPIGEKGAVFRDSLVRNVEELADVLPKLNLFEDPIIANMARYLKGDLSNTSLHMLRTDPTVRAERAERARKLAEVAKSYLF